MHSVRTLIISAIIATYNVPDASAAPTASGCGENGSRILSSAKPLGSGPLSLSKVYCLPIPPTSVPRSPPQPSADLRNFFVFDSVNGLTIVSTGQKYSVRRFEGRMAGSLDKLPFSWMNSSQAVLGVRQNTAKPSGFALGPVQSHLFPVDRPARQLPRLASAAGPLDEVYWMSGTGRAIAAFGTMGSSYKPEHDDSRPTLAFVDAAKGKVSQTITMASIPGLSSKARVGAISHTSDAKGLITALLAFQSNQWVVWAQGKAPRNLQLGMKYVHQFAVAPSGRDVLVMKNLSATGMFCERNPNCPPPTPQTGSIAELRSLSTGRIVWSVNGTAREFSGSDVPAISPDGRYALISLPWEKRRSTTALISMASGKVIQQIPRPWMSGCAVGFSRDSRKAWISGGATVYVFSIKK